MRRSFDIQGCRGLAVGVALAFSLIACRSAQESATAPAVQLEASTEAQAILTTLRAQFDGVRSARSAAVGYSVPVLSPGVARGFSPSSDAMRPLHLSPRFSPSTELPKSRLLLGARSARPFHLEDSASGVWIDVSVEGVRDVAALMADRYLVYPRAHASGATLLHRALPAGLEDFLSFDERPRIPEVRYVLTLGGNVAGLRVVANTLEMVDAGGSPRLRVAPPFLVGADGVRTEATLAVDGCAIDQNPSGPWGRSVTPPGAASCTVRVMWDDHGVEYPAILDPRWTTTGSMTSPRQGHSATLLSTGRC
jgi:hypothetical protein